MEVKKTDSNPNPYDIQSPVSIGTDQDPINLDGPSASASFHAQNLSRKLAKNTRWKNLNQSKLEVLSKLAKKEKLNQTISEEEAISTDNSNSADESMEEDLNSLLAIRGPESLEINNNSNKTDEASTSPRTPVVKKRRTSCHSIPSTRGSGRPPNSEKLQQKKPKLSSNSLSDLDYDPDNSPNIRFRMFTKKPFLKAEDRIETLDQSATRIRTSSLSGKDQSAVVSSPTASATTESTSLLTSIAGSVSPQVTNPTRKKSN